MINVDNFLFEATRRLFSSLQAESSLWSFYSFIKQKLPVREFNLNKTLMPYRHVLRVAKVMDDGVHLDWSIAPISDAQRKLGMDLGLDSPSYGITERMILSHNDALFCYFMLGPDVMLTPPLFFLRLIRDGNVIGSAIFQTTRPLTEGEQTLLCGLDAPLCSALNNMLQFRELAELKEQLMLDNERLRRKLSGLTEVEIIGQKGGLSGVMKKVRMAAPVDVPVLITGETGTGKEIVAKAVHELSARNGKAFVAVNCGAIPPSLIDSELFGHAKGAFTGAMAVYKGRFERADGGTLFLDEVGELPLEAQSRLLRVLETGEVERIGGATPLKVDIRLIAATHRDLSRMVREETFREDLYYRLRVVSIQVPPLRRRKEDIPQLVEFLLRRSSVRYGVMPPPVAPGQMEHLMNYDWPGNVRELQNTLEEALVCSCGQPLRFSLGQPRYADPPRSEDQLTDLDAVMREYLVRCLRACHGKVDGPGGAAGVAGLTPSTFRFRCKKLGVVPRQVL